MPNPSATAEVLLLYPPMTQLFKHLGDFLEVPSLISAGQEEVLHLLNREGNYTFCHCTFLAHRGPLLQPWRSDTILSRPRPSTGEEDATNIKTQPGKQPMNIIK